MNFLFGLQLCPVKGCLRTLGKDQVARSSIRPSRSDPRVHLLRVFLGGRGGYLCVEPLKAHRVPGSRDFLARRGFKSVDSWFDHRSDLVGSFPVSSRLARFPFFRVFENLAHDEVPEFERSSSGLFVVASLDLVLVILNS